ncbi:DVU_1551 family NTP transferase [Desulfosarcina sp.]|uniref:DVU_1551 family NTP transferase n=1 Tax=Desulfosarcina sp. TaxID=2027861 RepID=UPI003970E360
MALQRNQSVIILAAGYSRRMRPFKPLLILDGETVLQRVVSLYRSAGMADIRVVTGFRSQAIASELAGKPVCLVHNPAHDAGMFTSVLAGVRSLPADVGSFFVHPVDIPLVRPHTLAQVMNAFDRSLPPVAYALFDDRRGHPPLIHGQLRDDMLRHDGSCGLRGLLCRYDSAALEVQVADEGILMDLDTPEDFQRLSTRLARSDRLTENECRVLMEKVHRLPGKLIGHCLQVACVAETLAEAVNGSGGAIDASLVRSAAQVHDVARLAHDHAAAGADLLNAMGFPAMAAIVALHMDIPVSPDSRLDEAQIVHLADKLVSGTTVMSLAQRFETKMKRYSHDAKVAAQISRRRSNAFRIQEKLEQASGSTIGQILKKAGITFIHSDDN